MKGRRWKSATPVSDFSITQKIRTTLVEDGHSDLVVEEVTQAVKELEEELALAKRRITALESQWRDDRMTESGVHRIITKVMHPQSGIRWKNVLLKAALVGAAGAVGTGVVGGAYWFFKMAWIGWHKQ